MKNSKELTVKLIDALSAFKRVKFNDNRQNSTNISHADRHILWLIYNMNSGKPVMASEIAKKLDVTMAAVTHSTSSLEKQKYIVKNISPIDKRVTYIKITLKGKLIIRQMKRKFFKKIKELIEHLGEKDTQKLISIIEKLTKFVNKND